MANDGTVKIGVEFSKNDIQKGYKTIQDEAKKTANSLKSVNDALKLDPKNTDLLIEKQKLLTKAVAAAELQVSELSKELEKAKESGLEEKDAAAYRELVTSLSRATVEAKQYNDELKDVNKSLDLDHGSVDILVEKQKLLAQVVADSENKVTELTRALEEAKKAGLEKEDAEAYEALAEELEKAKESAKQYANELDSLGESAGNSSGGIDSLFNSVAGGVMVGNLAADAVGFLIGKAAELIDWVWNLDEATEEYREAMGKLNTAFESAGFSVETAKQAYTEFYKILGDTDTATEASQLLASLARNEEDIAKWTDIAAGVYGTFGDALPIEGLIEAANETAKTGKVTGVLADALNWVGMSEDEFNERLATMSTEGERARFIMGGLSAAYSDAADAFYENNEVLIETRENQAKLDEVQAELGESVANLKNKFFELFGPAIIDAIKLVSAALEGVVWVVDKIGQALEWLGQKINDVIGFFQELFGASNQASNISVSEGSETARNSLPRHAPSPPAPSDDGGGPNPSPSPYSPSRAPSALETAIPTARSRVISDLAAAIPVAQNRVAIATAEMAPSAAYSSPPPAGYSGGNAGDRQQQPIILRPNWTMRFEGELAQFAQVFKPVIDAEDARVGQGVQ